MSIKLKEGMNTGQHEVFVTPERLKDLIIKYIKEEEQSISALSRRLNTEGHKMHRLVLTGYLKALSDLGVLKEKDIPPSKVYSTSAHRDKNLYEKIGEKCMLLNINDEEKPKLAAYILQELFHRPIFLEEIKECGFEESLDDDLRVTGEERREAKSCLSSSGLKLPHNDPAYSIDNDYSEMFDEVLHDIIIDMFKVRRLVHKTKQIKLGEM